MIKGTSARVEKRHVQYRSFKGFDEKQFCSDVGQIPFDAAYVFDDVDDIYWAHEWLLTEVIHEHAPIKSRVVKSNKPPYMNGDLKRAVYKKRMLFNKYKKCKSSINWENYRLERNRLTKLKKTSMRVFFFERCAGGPKLKDIWPTIKPFLSKKGTDGGSEILLSEDEKIISDQEHVFNDFFVNVAKDIGNSGDTPNDLSTHPSVINIAENIPEDTPKFFFQQGIRRGCPKYCFQI